MLRRTTTLLIIASACCALTHTLACEIRVRDSAFRTIRDVHKICVVGESSDVLADRIEQRLDDWLEATGRTINLEVVRVDGGDPETNWRAIGLPSAPPTLPVTVLVGRNNGTGESFVIDHWEPGPTDEELAAILDSPLRQELAQKLARNVAVLVLVLGETTATGESGATDETTVRSTVVDRVQSIVDSGIADERLGLAVVMLDRNDPAERIVCRFMGLRPDGDDTLFVAFGRGKLMSPPLVGDQINETHIGNLVTQIRQACSCSLPLQTMGVDLPLSWSETVDSSVLLMDEEIDLAELGEEVQNMLSAKAARAEIGEPVLLSIPAGRGELLSEVDGGRWAEPPTYGFVVVAGIVVMGIPVCWWLRRVRFGK